MTNSEVVLVFTEKARSWVGRKSKETDIALVGQLNQLGFTAFLNNYTLAFHNLKYPIVLIGGAKFLKAWSLPNPVIAVPQLTQAGEIDFLQRDERVQVVFLPASQIDFLDDARVRVGNVSHPTFAEKLLDALQVREASAHLSTVTG